MDSQEQCGDGFGLWGSVDEPAPAAPSPYDDMRRFEAPADAVRSRLASIIENEIVPRLMLAHSMPVQCAPPVRKAGIVADLDGFVSLVLAKDGEPAYAHVERLLAGGMSRESLFLDVLAAAARRLGELWEADLCDFLEVTAGLNRLQNILHEMSPDVRGPETSSGRRILLACTPGERHTFGVSMVASFFRTAGWEVAGDGVDALDPVEAVSQRRYGVVGLSLGSELHLEALGCLIRNIRRASLNPSLGVMVGGQFFLRRPELVTIVGADLTATDGLTAVLLAQSLLDLRASAC